MAGFIVQPPLPQRAPRRLKSNSSRTCCGTLGLNTAWDRFSRLRRWREALHDGFFFPAAFGGAPWCGLVFSLSRFSGLFWPGPFFPQFSSMDSKNGATECAWCRSRRELSNECLLAKNRRRYSRERASQSLEVIWREIGNLEGEKIQLKCQIPGI